MYSFDELKKYCSDIGCSFKENEPMRDYTTFRIGGPADILAVPDTADKAAELIKYAARNGIDYYILGKGSNVLVSDTGIRGLVVLTSSLEGIEYDGDTITCLSGTPLIRLCMSALESSLTGLEFAYGIPGSAGGAAYMNAGAYGGEMKDVIVSCNHIDKSGNTGSFNADELGLGYRRSVYCENGFFITSVTLKLNIGNPAEIREKMDDLLSRRKDKQPLDYPSAGSTFKRPQGNYAGALIEQCGLKGFSVGGAQVSEKHAGFVINKGGATAKDVMALVDSVRETVFKETGYDLEPEIKFIG